MVGVSCSNNTNKFSPQEHDMAKKYSENSSNNTNKFSPQEHVADMMARVKVQIIQINSVLKNVFWYQFKRLVFK